MKSQFNYFYKKYDTIRMILRKIYIYGCYNRNDYKEIVSPRKFDNELKRITMLFNNEQLVQSYKGKNKYSIINFDYFLETSNLLTESYYAKAFKDNELKLYILIMQTLSNDDMSLADIEGALIEHIGNIDRATLRNHLDKMVDEGYLCQKIHKNKKIYFQANQLLAHLTTAELVQLSDCIGFYKDTGNIKLPGYYILSTINQQLTLCDTYMERSYYVFKHSFRHHILDEEVIIALLNAIQSEQSVCFIYAGKPIVNVSPIKIIHDVSFGRIYLIGFSAENGTLGIYRIDKIVEVKKGSLFASVAIENLDKAWCVSGIGKKMQQIKIEFLFNDIIEKHLIARLYRESKHGQIEKLAENAYRFSIDVLDSIEMVPWLRTFYGHIIHVNNDDLKDYIVKDLKAMAVNYESV